MKQWEERKPVISDASPFSIGAPSGSTKSDERHESRHVGAEMQEKRQRAAVSAELSAKALFPDCRAAQSPV